MVAPDFIVGIIGNIVSIISFSSSIGTFREIVLKKSSENYKGVPYIATLVSTSLWTFYGLLDPDDGILIVTVNGVGLALQSSYIILFLFYASKERKVKYFGLVVLDFVFLAMVVSITFAAFHGDSRRTFIGILCATFTIGMYAAPLSSVRTVIRTKSIEYMPFFLSFSLFLNAAAWFTFAVLLKDYYILVPNAIGILLGSFQLLVYFIYRSKPSSSKLTESKTGEEKPAYSTANTTTAMQDVEGGLIIGMQDGSFIVGRSPDRPVQDKGLA